MQTKSAICAAYLLSALSIAGCSLTPEVQSNQRLQNSDVWPNLLPVETLANLTSGASTTQESLQAETDSLAQRVADLRARAARLNRPVLTSQEKTDLSAAAGAR